MTRLRAPLALAALALIAAGCGRRVAIGGSQEDDTPSTPSPCEGQPCGAPCSLSPCGATPGPGCSTPEPMGLCDSQGQCSQSFPLCGQPPPCLGEPCGAPCDPCQGEPNCPSPGPSLCNGGDACVPADEILCPSPPNPCGGLLCGALCDPCGGVPGCDPPATTTPFRCDDSAACVPAEAVVCPGGYVPCDGKACGDPCSICQPDYPCEPLPPFTCDMFGQCVEGSVVCG